MALGETNYPFMNIIYRPATERSFHQAAAVLVESVDLAS